MLVSVHVCESVLVCISTFMLVCVYMSMLCACKLMCCVRVCVYVSVRAWVCECVCKHTYTAALDEVIVFLPEGGLWAWGAGGRIWPLVQMDQAPPPRVQQRCKLRHAQSRELGQ